MEHVNQFADRDRAIFGNRGGPQSCFRPVSGTSSPPDLIIFGGGLGDFNLAGSHVLAKFGQPLCLDRNGGFGAVDLDQDKGIGLSGQPQMGIVFDDVDESLIQDFQGYRKNPYLKDFGYRLAGIAQIVKGRL